MYLVFQIQLIRPKRCMAEKNVRLSSITQNGRDKNNTYYRFASLRKKYIQFLRVRRNATAAAMQNPEFAAHTWYLITSPAEVGMEEVPNTASYRCFLLIQRGKLLWSKNIQTLPALLK